MPIDSAIRNVSVDSALAQISLFRHDAEPPAGFIQLKGGLNNHVYRYQDLVIKISGLNDPAVLEREAQSLKLLHTKINVPEVYHYGCIESGSKTFFLFMQLINGSLLTEGWAGYSSDDHERFVKSIGSQLQILHALPHAFLPQFSSNKISTYLSDCFNRGVISNAQHQDLLAYLDPLSASLNNESSLVFTHGDIYLGNIIKEESTQALYFIDFDSVAAAPQSRDLVGFIYNAFDPFSPATSYVRKGHDNDLALLRRYYEELFCADNLIDSLRGYFVERVAWFMDKAIETKNPRYQEFGEGLYRQIVAGSFLKKILAIS